MHRTTNRSKVPARTNALTPEGHVTDCVEDVDSFTYTLAVRTDDEELRKISIHNISSIAVIKDDGSKTVVQITFDYGCSKSEKYHAGQSFKLKVNEMFDKRDAELLAEVSNPKSFSGQSRDRGSIRPAPSMPPKPVMFSTKPNK